MTKVNDQVSATHLGDGVVTLEDVAKLLREFQFVEWSLDKRITKKALRDQRHIILRLLEMATGRKVSVSELDQVITSMN